VTSDSVSAVVAGMLRGRGVEKSRSYRVCDVVDFRRLLMMNVQRCRWEALTTAASADRVRPRCQDILELTQLCTVCTDIARHFLFASHYIVYRHLVLRSSEGIGCVACEYRS
jgi:hypothetical protein